MIPQAKEMLLCFIAALPLWLVLRRPWRKHPASREILLALFIPYMAALLYQVLKGQWAWPHQMLQLAVSRQQSGDKIHMQPLSTISRQLAQPTLTNRLQLLGNTLLFIPWGFCLPLLWPCFRTPLRLLLAALALTCAIEFTQLFIDRYVEVDDVLLNALGSLLGSGFWWIGHRLFMYAHQKRS